jgi:hypothetical protein
MSRLDLLRMKRTASSYGQSLTLLEQLELARLEADLDDQRLGRGADTELRYREPALAHDPAAAFLCEA